MITFLTFSKVGGVVVMNFLKIITFDDKLVFGFW